MEPSVHWLSGTWLKTHSVMQHFYRTCDKILFRYIDLGKSGFPYPSELKFRLMVDMVLIFNCLKLHGSSLRHLVPVARNFFVFPLKENSPLFVPLIPATL